MKTRLDFVSNSSSSSFVLFGMAGTEKELLEFIDAPDEIVSSVEKNDGSYDFETFMLEKIHDVPGLELRLGLTEYSGEWIIGVPFSEMREDETKRHFIMRVRSMLGLVFTKNLSKCYVAPIADGGYD